MVQNDLISKGICLNQTHSIERSFLLYHAICVTPHAWNPRFGTQNILFIYFWGGVS